MAYRLRIDRTRQLVWDSLPQAACEQLTLALARVVQDPLGETRPYGDAADDVMRMLVLDATKTVRIMQITYIG